MTDFFFFSVNMQILSYVYFQSVDHQLQFWVVDMVPIFVKFHVVYKLHTVHSFSQLDCFSD